MRGWLIDFTRSTLVLSMVWVNGRATTHFKLLRQVDDVDWILSP